MNITELKALAEKATPGPWHIRTNRHPNTDGTPWGWLDLYEAGSMRQASPEGIQVTWSKGRTSENNARYVAAANPAAILELIAANEDAQGEIRALRATEQNLRERVTALESGLRRATDALDLLTDKVDGTGFAESDEFSNALDEIDLGRALLEQKP